MCDRVICLLHTRRHWCFLFCFVYLVSFFFSSRRRHTGCALVIGVQTCALPISLLAAQGRRGKPDAACRCAPGRLKTSIMLKALSRAFSQAFDPAFRRVFNRSLLYSLITFIAVWLASWFALDWAGEWLIAWVRDWAGEIGRAHV